MLVAMWGATYTCTSVPVAEIQDCIPFRESINALNEGRCGDLRDKTSLKRRTGFFSKLLTYQQVKNLHKIPGREKGGTATEEKLRTGDDAENAYLYGDPQVRADTRAVSDVS